MFLYIFITEVSVYMFLYIFITVYIYYNKYSNIFIAIYLHIYIHSVRRYTLICSCIFNVHTHNACAPSVPWLVRLLPHCCGFIVLLFCIYCVFIVRCYCAVIVLLLCFYLATSILPYIINIQYFFCIGYLCSS